MSSVERLKIINSDSFRSLEELLVNCQNVKFVTDSQNSLILVGYWENKLCIMPAMSPTTSQVLDFNENVILCECQPNRIYVLLGSNKIVLITNRNGKWKSGKEFTFNLEDQSILNFLPLNEDLMVCLKDGISLEMSYSSAGQNLSHCAYIDCLKEAQSAVLHLLSSSTLLVGTDDGHVYQLSLDKRSKLQLICDIQQPVAFIMILPSDQVAVIGRHGKIVLLSNSFQIVLTTFTPSAIIHQCSSFDSFLYINGDDQQLYSTELKSSENVIEAKYCRVKFVRSFHIDNNRKLMVILTEDGVIYESSLHFQEKGFIKGGSDMKSILGDIQQSAKKMKELNLTSENVRKDLDQVSMALQMIGEDQSTKFLTTSRSFPSLDSEKLRISITNNSSRSYLASHWSLHIEVNRSSTTSAIKEIWTTGTTLELEHPFQLTSTNFDIQVRVTLVFRANDPFKKPVCIFPLSEIKLDLLDFLEPAPSNHIFDKNKTYDLFGFNRNLIEIPWPFLLSRSWHRGFQQLLTDPSAPEVSLRYDQIPLKLSFKESSEFIWILRIDTTDKNLLKNIRLKLFQMIFPVSKVSSGFVRVPSHVLAQLQSLRGRLNYIRSLESWDETDTEPLRDEMRLLMAKYFPIR